MTRKSIDVYATTNAALCSLVIWSFCKGYADTDVKGAEYPLVFLPVPIVLSKSLVRTFEGTNSRTGFLTWVTRNPEITIDFAEKLERTTEYTRKALLFGIYHQLYTINGQGRLLPIDDFKLTDTQKRELADDIKGALTYSQRLGTWLGQLDSAKNAFHSLGLTL